MIRRAELGKLIADPNNELLAKAFVNRMWAHFLGRGSSTRSMTSARIIRPAIPSCSTSSPRNFKQSGYDVKKLCRWIMLSRAYQLSSVKIEGQRQGRGPFSQMQLKPMTPEQLFDSLLTATPAHRAGCRR